MGARANYAIREYGAVTLFYAHWGANTIAEDIFWGPERTREFVRKNTPASDWLDDRSADGGVALDVDNRVLTYLLYWEAWPYEDDVKHVYEQLLAENWQGWTVRPASEWTEIAEAVGVPASAVTAIRKPPIRPRIRRTWRQPGEGFQHPESATVASVPRATLGTPRRRMERSPH